MRFRFRWKGRIKGENLRREKLISELKKIHPREDPIIAADAFYRKCKSYVLLGGLGIVLLMGLLCYLDSRRQLLGADYSLRRNPLGEGAYRLNLIAETEAGEIPIEVTVEETMPTEAEQQRIFEAAKKEIDEKICGENPSLSEITHDLVLPDSVVDGLVTIRWKFSNYDVIRSNGHLTDFLEEGEESMIEITAVLSCGDAVCDYSFYGIVKAKSLDEDSLLQKEIQKELKSSSIASAKEEKWVLPTAENGPVLAWKERKQGWALRAGGMLMLLGILLLYHERQRITETCKVRDLSLKREYALLVNKITLLLGAGLTIPMAWRRILQDMEVSDDMRQQFLREEMQVTLAQMEKGIPAGVAIEDFGRRSGLQSYMKFTALLSQNLSKGSKGLEAALLQEVNVAFEERKMVARELAEEAGTKLLLPMGMLLAVVLVIVMLPGLWSL